MDLCRPLKIGKSEDNEVFYPYFLGCEKDSLKFSVVLLGIYKECINLLSKEEANSKFCNDVICALNHEVCGILSWELLLVCAIILRLCSFLVTYIIWFISSIKPIERYCNWNWKMLNIILLLKWKLAVVWILTDFTPIGLYVSWFNCAQS